MIDDRLMQKHLRRALRECHGRETITSWKLAEVALRNIASDAHGADVNVFVVRRAAQTLLARRYGSFRSRG